MITIKTRAKGTITTLIEDIRALWDFKNVVTDDSGAVTQLWVTDEVYLLVNEVNFYVKTKSSKLTLGSGSTSIKAYNSSYLIVKTDEALAIFGGYADTSAANRQCIIIGKTADVFDSDYSGYGVVACGAGSSAFSLYGQLAPLTDKSTAVNALSTESAFLNKSADTQTQIFPIVDRSSSLYFANLNYKLCSPSVDSFYKAELNGKKYYVTPYVAIEYEE